MNDNNMEFTLLKESKVYSKQDILKWFNLKKDDDILDFLLDKKIIKNNNNNIDLYSLQYVGYFMYKENIAFAFPKYIANLNELNIIKEISEISYLMFVYSKYENMTSEEVGTLGNPMSTNNNIISLALYLLEDFFENGLYKKSSNALELNGDGEVEWNYTIQQFFPIISGKNLIYDDLYTNQEVMTEVQNITEVHKIILNQCFKLLKFLHLDILLNDMFILFDINETKFNSLDMLNVLDSELLIEFNDLKKHRLQSMFAFVNRINNLDSSNNIMLFGTSYFYNVWEKVCAFVFSNLFNLKKYKIDFPKWNINYDSFQASKTLTPDIIGEMFYKNVNITYILDAKYYTYNNFNSTSSIAIGDITKQYLYNMAIEDSLYKNNNTLFENGFLLPVFREESRYIGNVSLDFLTKTSNQKISLYALNTNQLYDQYVNRTPFKNQQVFKLLIDRSSHL